MSRTRRRRSADPAAARPGPRPGPIEALESRQLLTGQLPYISLYQPTVYPRIVQYAPATPTPLHPVQISSPAALDALNNAGKFIQGTDAQGDQYTIVVNGPGYAVVTDTNPSDGVLNSNIDTIQLVGTDPNRTTVVGQVTPSPRVVSSGVVTFQHLTDLSGVKSIVLDGFSLTTPPTVSAAASPGIYLAQGVGYLEFRDVQAPIDLAAGTMPVNIIIGDPSSPLKVQPVIHLQSIENTVFNSGVTTNPNVPQTVPTVNLIVNGQLRDLNIESATASPQTATSAAQAAFPVVGTTGRTAVRATAIGHLGVAGTARNFTVSRSATPFSGSFSGLSRLGSATFGGNADAVGLDVSRGRIGHLDFARGIGSPNGVVVSPADYGQPAATAGYPSFGLYGGLISAGSIGALGVGPSSTIRQTSQNPNLIQSTGNGTTHYFVRPGNALINTVVASAGSIGKTEIAGNLTNSEIKAGFDYPSYVQGLEGTRGVSTIGPYRQVGDLINSDVSASYRPANHQYGSTGSVAGPGKITGSTTGNPYINGQTTPLGNTGAGFFARVKRGRLPNA